MTVTAKTKPSEVISMKKKLPAFICFSVGTVLLCCALSLLYKNFAFGKLEPPLNIFQNIFFPVFALIVAAVIIVRFIMPALFRPYFTVNKGNGIVYQFADYGAWLFFALSLAALVASPLAETADYIGYAALFIVISLILAGVSVVPVLEAYAYAKCSSNTVMAFGVFGFLLFFLPGIGICAALTGIIMAVTALREMRASKDTAVSFLILDIIGALLSAAVTFCFVYFLMLK